MPAPMTVTAHPTDPWPAAQIDAYHRDVAAILTHIGLTHIGIAVDSCI